MLACLLACLLVLCIIDRLCGCLFVCLFACLFVCSLFVCCLAIFVCCFVSCYRVYLECLPCWPLCCHTLPKSLPLMKLLQLQALPVELLGRFNSFMLERRQSLAFGGVRNQPFSVKPLGACQRRPRQKFHTSAKSIHYRQHTNLPTRTLRWSVILMVTLQSSAPTRSPTWPTPAGQLPRAPCHDRPL